MKIKRTHSIMFKIVLILIIGFILPFIVQIFGVSSLMNRIVQDKILTMAKKNVENSALRIQDNIQAQFDMTWFYSEDDTVMHTIERLSLADDKELSMLKSEVILKLVSKNNIDRYAYPFHFYLLDYRGHMMTNFAYTPDADYEKTYQKIAEMEWFGELKNAYTKKTAVFAETDFLNADGPQKFYIATNIIGKQEKGVFMIAIDSSALTKQMSAIFPTGKGYLMEKDKRCLLTSNQDGNRISEEILPLLKEHEVKFQKEELVTAKIGEVNYLFMEQPIMIKGLEPKWKLLIIVPFKDITGEIADIYTINIFVFLLYAAAVVFVIAMLNKNIVKPIRTLGESVKEVTRGNLNVSIGGMPDNELGELGKGFQVMVQTLDDHIRNIKKNEILQREVEVRLLQNQIKPHFVRNALNTIRWLAEINGVKSVGESIMALSGLLEYNFRDSKMLTTVEDEMTYVKDYLYLQKLRYQNKFKDCYEIEEKILNYPVLKLSFQPVVENCIYHGILNKEGVGMIKIKGYLKEETMIFEISDNGFGIQEEAVLNLLEPPLSEDIMEKTKGTDSIALWNINQRIQRQFGKKYGLEIKSEIGRGTMVVFKFPIWEERDL